MGTRCADHVTPLYPQKLALTSPTGGGRSVCIVRSRTKATDFGVCLSKLRRFFSFFAVKIQASDKYVTTGLMIFCMFSTILHRLEFKWTNTVFFSELITLILLTVYTTVSVLRNTLLRRYDTITSHVSQAVFPPNHPQPAALSHLTFHSSSQSVPRTLL